MTASAVHRGTGILPAVSRVAVPSPYKELYRASLERAERAFALATPGIPPLQADGFLPAGIHHATWSEFAERFGFGERRIDLLQQLASRLDDYDRLALGAGSAGARDAGRAQVVIAGSMTSSKLHPGDVDVAYGAGADDVRRLLDGADSWEKTGDIHAYAAAALPEGSATLPPGPRRGINFLEMFQGTRNDTRRGVVLLDVAQDATRSLAARLHV